MDEKTKMIDIKPESLEAIRRLFPGVTEEQVQEFLLNFAKQIMKDALPKDSKVDIDKVLADYSKKSK